MVRVINNNLWTPVPWGFGCGGHQCNGDNNWMQKMFGYQMLFNMMQKIGRCYATPPQQQGGFYPGLYLGGGGGGAAMPQSYEEYLQQQQDAQSLTELKSAYSEFNIRKIGDRYFAYLKSDKTQRIEADSVDELMDGLNEYVDQNPDKFKAKPAKVETSTDTGDDASGTDDADTTAAGTDGAGKPPTSGAAQNPAGATPAGTDAKRRGPKPPENWPLSNTSNTWYNSHFTSKNKEAKTALDLVNEIKYTGYTVTFANDEAKQRLADDIAKYNVSMFDENGKVIEGADWTKLNLPNLSAIKTYATVNATAKTGKELAHVCKLYPGSSYRYVFYDANGNQMDELTYANTYPDKYLASVKNLKDKYWSPETFKKAMELYNNKYMDPKAQMAKDKGFKEFKIIYDKDTGKPKVWCDYRCYRGLYANYTVSFDKGYQICELEQAFININNSNDSITAAVKDEERKK